MSLTESIYMGGARVTADLRGVFIGTRHYEWNDLDDLSLGIERRRHGGHAFIEMDLRADHTVRRWRINNDDEPSLFELEQMIALGHRQPAHLLDDAVPFAFRPPDPTHFAVHADVLFLSEVQPIPDPRSWLGKILGHERGPTTRQVYAELSLTEHHLTWDGGRLAWSDLRDLRLVGRDLVFELRDGSEHRWSDIAHMHRRDLVWLHERILEVAQARMHDDDEEAAVREGAQRLRRRS